MQAEVRLPEPKLRGRRAPASEDPRLQSTSPSSRAVALRSPRPVVTRAPSLLPRSTRTPRSTEVAQAVLEPNTNYQRANAVNTQIIRIHNYQIKNRQQIRSPEAVLKQSPPRLAAKKGRARDTNEKMTNK